MRVMAVARGVWSTFGVEPSAESHFDDGKVDLRLCEDGEGRDCRRFEEGELGKTIEHGVQPMDEAILGDRLAADLDAFREPKQVRGGVEPDAMAGGASHGVHHRRDAPFSVGARDVHAGKTALGVPQGRAGGAHPFEPEERTARGELVQALEHRAFRRNHSVGRRSRCLEWPFELAARLAMRCMINVASVAFISPRGTMRSTMPCAKRNSDR